MDEFKGRIIKFNAELKVLMEKYDLVLSCKFLYTDSGIQAIPILLDKKEIEEQKKRNQSPEGGSQPAEPAPSKPSPLILPR